MGIKNIKAFKKRANTQHIPLDLENWLSNRNNCAQVFAELGFVLLTDEEIMTIQNPNQMDFEDDATYFATKHVFLKIVLVAKNNKGMFFGYSLHDDISLINSPITTYHSFFELSPGSLTEALLFELVDGDEVAYNTHKQALEECDFNMAKFQDLKKDSDSIFDNYIDPDDQIDILKNGKDLSLLSFKTSDEVFLAWRAPRFGIENPSIINSQHWKACIYSREGAYTIDQKHNGVSNTPTWCFSRFGQSITRIDGKEIYIAGEHEDYYDENFYIYNDVVVVNSDNSVEIYNYPKAIFPQTDFHSASLIDSQTILIIGNLGYAKEREKNITPVYSLNITAFKIKKIVTYGDNPGWIYKHRAIVNDTHKSIKIVGGEIQSQTNLENIDEWQLDLKTYQWTRLTEKRWKRWRVYREDKKRNHLWDIRQALLSSTVSWKSGDKEIGELREKLNYPIDVTKIEELYQFNNIPTYKKLLEADKYDIFKISINDVTIKFKESFYDIIVSVEGNLDDKIIEMVQDTILRRASELENCKWVLKTHY